MLFRGKGKDVFFKEFLAWIAAIVEGAVPRLVLWPQTWDAVELVGQVSGVRARRQPNALYTPGAETSCDQRKGIYELLILSFPRLKQPLMASSFPQPCLRHPTLLRKPSLTTSYSLACTGGASVCMCPVCPTASCCDLPVNCHWVWECVFTQISIPRARPCLAPSSPNPVCRMTEWWLTSKAHEIECMAIQESQHHFFFSHVLIHYFFTGI